MQGKFQLNNGGKLGAVCAERGIQSGSGFSDFQISRIWLAKYLTRDKFVLL